MPRSIGMAFGDVSIIIHCSSVNLSNNKKRAINIVEVLVLQRFPYGKDSTFFYYVLANSLSISVGDVLKVPWRRGEKMGVAVKVKKITVNYEPSKNWKVDLNSFIKSPDYFFSNIPPRPINLKPVSGIVEKKYLSPDSLYCLRMAAKHYFVSWNHFANSAVEISSSKNSSTNLGKTQRSSAKYSYLSLLRDWMISREKYSGFVNDKEKNVNIAFKGKTPFIFFTYEQESCLRSLLRKTLKRGKQVLVVVPEKNQLFPIAGKYLSLTNSFSVSSPICLAKLLPQRLFRSAWRLTRENKPYLFVGTRSSIFAPFSNLGMVILEEGHDASYKQWDLSPLYDVRELLAAFYPSVIKIYLSSTPRLQNFYDSPFYLARDGKRFEVKTLNLDSLEKRKARSPISDSESKSPYVFSRSVKFESNERKVVLINMNAERRASQNPSPISEYLKKGLTTEIKKKKWTLLLADHEGIANIILCRDCGFIPRCPRCGKILAYQTKLSLVCRFCGFSQKPFIRCPKCSGHKFNFAGFGIEKVKEALEEIKRELDFSLLIPSYSGSAGSAIYSFSKEIISKRNEPVVILGYSGILPIGRILRDKIGLAAILSFDDALFYADYRAEERAAARFYNLLSFAKKVYLQTSDPMQPYLQKIIHNPYSALYPDWIRERRKFNYPPFSKIVKIEVPTSNSAFGEKTAGKIINKLRREEVVLEAASVSFPKIIGKANKYSAGVLVKLKKNADGKSVIGKLFREFGNLKIDPNPEELF